MEGTTESRPTLTKIARTRGRGRKGLLSKKRLFADLEALGLETFTGIREKGLKHSRVSNETYGKTSCIYLHCASEKERFRVEGLLGIMGHRVNTNYHPGYHWDE